MAVQKKNFIAPVKDAIVKIKNEKWIMENES
jgi:hypothetical protein